MSAEFLDEIERVRTTAISRRESDAPPSTLSEQLTGREPRDAEALVRAFSTYFQVVNIAERVHRIRRRREYQRSGTDTPQPDGLHDALRRLKAQGVTLDELSQWLPRIDVEPVFTAHPTEAVRRALLEKEQLMVASLVDNLDGMRTPNERTSDAARFRMALTASWQTADSSPVRPTVGDEREHVGFYLTQVLYRVIPVMYETLEHAIEETYGSVPALPRLLRFGTWVGGDMDGNPNVDANTIAGTLDAQRRAVLDRYQRELWQLASLLSQSTTLVQVSPELMTQLERYRALLPDAAARSRPRHGDMPYRLLNDLMRARLQATLDDADGAYTAPSELEDDLQLILDSLQANKGLHAGWFAVRRLLWRVRSFGFHLARLDVRQESSVHARAVADALGQTDWDGQDATRRAPCSARMPPVKKPCRARRMKQCAAGRGIRRARRCTHAHGADALGSYIISMAHNRADVLTVLALARRGGLVDAAGAVPLDIVPLFETVDDLRGGTGTVQDLLADPVYRQHLPRAAIRRW